MTGTGTGTATATGTATTTPTSMIGRAGAAFQRQRMFSSTAKAPSQGSGGAQGGAGPRARRAATAASNSNTLAWLGVAIVGTFGLSYASVPLYRLFCQVTGYGGTTQKSQELDYSKLTPLEDRELRIQFSADTAVGMPWKFVPTQREIRIVPGQTVLACFTATNTSDEPIVGVATYNVTPQKAGKYFHKVQCFCFEAQRLNPKEEVDMPVFFYVDPAIADDIRMNDVNLLTLSYTFFKSHDDFDDDDDDEDDDE